MTQHAQHRSSWSPGPAAGSAARPPIAFGARGAAVALLARGESGLAGRRQGGARRPGGARCRPRRRRRLRRGRARRGQRSRSELGPIDVWVNVAFTSVFAPFDEISAGGVPPGHRGQLPRLRLRHAWPRCAGCAPRDRGTIVQVGSALAYRGIPLQTAYCGAKHAIQGFHESLRCELLHEHSGVHVTMVQMPAVNTPQFSWVLSRLPRQAAAGAADLPAGGGRPGRRCTPPTTRGGGSTGSAAAPSAPWSPTRSRPGLLDRYLARTGFDAQQTDQPQRPRPAGQPLGAGRRGTGRLRRARRASTTGRRPRSLQLWASQHHGLLAVAGRGSRRRDRGRGARRAPLTAGDRAQSCSGEVTGFGTAIIHCGGGLKSSADFSPAS